MRLALAALCLVAAVPAASSGQGRPEPAALISAQRTAMAKLAAMDGVWRGSAWALGPGGRHDVVHTERVGPFLDGSLKVVEGRSYNADGSVGFNAFGIISFDPASGAYMLHSYAQGRAGDFPLKLEADGYSWDIPAGPGAVIRYRATIVSGAWKEVGYRVAAGGEPMQIFEMNLKRVGDSRWPGADPVPMK
jgi:hypothetical protein